MEETQRRRATQANRRRYPPLPGRFQIESRKDERGFRRSLEGQYSGGARPPWQMELCSEPPGLGPADIRTDGEISAKIGHESVPKMLGVMAGLEISVVHHDVEAWFDVVDLFLNDLSNRRIGCLLETAPESPENSLAP
ncbi:hypothetical protein KKB55_04760 [Myxococcota bacterium]|nr:hypothetical protein [Myxococcota bacterium]